MVQDTWLGAIRGIDKLKYPAAFPAWLFGVTQRKCVDWIRATNRHRQFDGALRSNTVEEPLIDREPDCEIDLAGAIRRLPAEQRAVVHLYYREDLDMSAIGRVLGVPAGTVKSRCCEDI